MVIKVQIKVPIQGWSTTAQLADYQGGEKIVASVSKTSSSVTASTKTPFTSRNKDNTNMINLNGDISIKSPGDYKLSISSNPTATGDSLLVFVNGVSTSKTIVSFNTAGTLNFGHVTLYDLKVNDVITLVPSATKTFSFDFDIEKITNPNFAIPTGPVAAIARNGYNQNIPNNTWTTLS